MLQYQTTLLRGCVRDRPMPLDVQRQQAVFDCFLDMVRSVDGDFAILGELARLLNDSESLDLAIAALSRHPEGKAAFQERYLLGAIDLERLHQLPTDTLGFCYADHLRRNHLKPLTFEAIDSDYAYLSAHITETHDIWHVITGSDTDIWGEIQLEAFYVVQMEASRFWMTLLAKNLLKAAVYSIEDSTRYLAAINRGWTMAQSAKPLFGRRWTELWDKPLADLRESLNIFPDRALELAI